MLTPTDLTATVDPAVYLVPEDYVAGSLSVMIDGTIQQPIVVYTAGGAGLREITFLAPPVGWVAGTWLTVAELPAGTYLSTGQVQARVGGPERYLELTDDNNDGDPDSEVERFLLNQVDALANSYLSRGGYTVPVLVLTIEPLIPALLDIANYKAKTRGNRIASDDDRLLFEMAMKQLEAVADQDFVLPGLEPQVTAEFGLDSPQSDINIDSDGRFFSRSRLRNF